MALCNSCGTENSYSENFCIECGKELQTSSPPADLTVIKPEMISIPAGKLRRKFKTKKTV